MRSFALAALVALALTATVSAVAGAAGGSPVVGYVYVNDNTAGTNTIAGFSRAPNGSLTPLPGSPFSAGGAGTGAGISSQGALQLSGDGHFLLAVDGGSNQISVLRIATDGSLQAVGAPVSSNGVDPVSIAVHGGLVYVANAGNGGSNYTGFTLDANGHLQPLAGSTVALPDGSQPGDVLFSGDGSKLVGTRIGTLPMIVGSSLIDSFVVGAGGLLTAAPGSPFTPQGFGPFGSEFRPGNSGQLYVSNAHTSAGTPAPGSVSAFTVAGNGALSPIGASPFSNPGVASCWVEISHDGAYLYAVDTGSSSVVSYPIASDGSLGTPTNTTLKGSGLGAEDARLAPDGGTLFVVDAHAAELSSLAVNGGNLTELAGSPTALPAGSAPAGVVVTENSLQGSNLQGANLENALLPNVNLQGSNLQGVNGNGGNFQGAQLQGVNAQHGSFENVDLTNAVLQGSNLQGDDFTGATLAGANLTGSNLQAANFTGANLTGASLTGANLNRVTWSNTTCPDGTNSNADGGTCQGHL